MSQTIKLKKDNYKKENITDDEFEIIKNKVTGYMDKRIKHYSSILTMKYMNCVFQKIGWNC